MRDCSVRSTVRFPAPRRPVLGIALGLLVLASSAQALTFVAQGGEASPGDTPDVCVSLADNNGMVAGFQMDLVWDSSCLTVDTASGSEGACFVVSDGLRNKSIRSSLQGGGNSLRILVLSLSDTAPIPASVRDLFCCQFRVSPAAAGRTCGVSVSNVIASDPAGNRISGVRAVPAAITVRRPDAYSGGPGPGLGAGAGVAPAPVVVEGGRAAPGTSGGAAEPAPAAQPRPAVPVVPGAVPAVPAAEPAGVPVPPAQVPAETSPALTAGEQPPEVSPEADATPASTAEPRRTREAVVSPHPTPVRTPSPASPQGTPTAKHTAAESPPPVHGTPARSGSGDSAGSGAKTNTPVGSPARP